MSRLVRFPAEECFDTHWNTVVMPLSIVGIFLWCVGVPAFGMVLCTRPNLPDFERLFLVQACFAGHRHGLSGCCWRLLAMVRVFFIALVAFLPLSPLEQFATIAAVLTFTVFFEARVKPRPIESMNMMEALQEVTLLIVLTMGNLYMSLTPESSIYELPAMVSWIAIISYLILCIAFFSIQVHNRHLERRPIRTVSDAAMITVVPGSSRLDAGAGLSPPPHCAWESSLHHGQRLAGVDNTFKPHVPGLAGL